MYVVPKGVMHKPHASTECKIMIVALPWYGLCAQTAPWRH